MAQISKSAHSLIVGLVLAPAIFAQHWEFVKSGTEASLRGVSVVSERIAWASGTGGTVLRSTDGGQSWNLSGVPNSSKLDFRGVEATDSNIAALMASGTGAESAVYKTEDGGASWRIWYPNHDLKGFFDAIAMPEPRRGVVLGDPVEGSFVYLVFDQAGGAYARVQMPEALPDEGAFAASNTSLVLRGKRVWFGTGGPSGARVFRSDDNGAHWHVSATPLRADSKGAGIFSIAFSDDRHGIAVGGNYEKPKEDAHNIARTADGGVTWTEPSGTRPRGYRSAVAWLPEHHWWIATGPSGSEMSRDGGENWIPFDDGAFNAIGVGPGDVCFAVGPKGRIAKLDFQKGRQGR